MSKKQSQKARKMFIGVLALFAIAGFALFFYQSPPAKTEPFSSTQRIGN